MRQMTIEKANDLLAKRYVTSGRYPEVAGCGIGNKYLVLYLKEQSTRTFPTLFKGFRVEIKITGEIKV